MPLSPMTTMPRLIPSCSLLALLCAPAAAQCTNPWSAENVPVGLWDEAHAVHRWDRDGAGPLPEVWVFAGDFTGAGTINANRIVTFDPATTTWAPLGAGVNGVVVAMTTLPNGNLVVAGEFTMAGGTPMNRIAVWNGSTWAPMGPGFDSAVYALTVRPNGNLVAGGSFTVPGSTSKAVAEWNGSVWSPVGSLGPAGSVRAFATLPNGDLLATGASLQLTSGGPNQWVIRWNGTAWTPFGTAAVEQPFFTFNRALLVRANGDVVLSGDYVFLLGGGFGYVVTWNGTSWTPMYLGVNSPPQRLCELTTGELVAAGQDVSKWTGTSWASFAPATGGGSVHSLAVLPAGGLLIAGEFDGGPNVIGAARWNGTTWLPVGAGGWFGEKPRVTVLPDGSIVVAITTTPFCYVGLCSASGITALGSGAGSVSALATLQNGDVIAAGAFTHFAGTAMNRIARWNGTSWSELGTGIGTVSTDYVAALAVAPNGDLVAGGRFTSAGGVPANSIARWNGTSWSALGGGFPSGGQVAALTVLTNGDVIAGGELASGTGPLAHIARWNGTSWLPLGPGLNQPPYDLAARHDGSVAACGLFTLPGPFGSTPQPGVAIWSPAAGTWTGLGTLNGGSIDTVLTAANGDLLIGGLFNNYSSLPLQNIARWNGTAWSGFGPAAARDLALAPNGDVAVAGGVAQPGGVQSPLVARLSTTCPAIVTPLGAACSGAGASPTLAATSLPWLRTTFRSRATGLPANSLALEVLGHTSLSVPLIAILPQGIAGCTLTTNPEVLNLHVPNAGAVDLALPLGSSIAFVGTNLYQQVVALSFGPSFDLVALTSSNSLQLTKGSF